MRTALRLLRLVARYGILCYLVVVAGLAVRAGQEAGWGLGSTDAPENVAQATLGVTVQLDELSHDERAAALRRLAGGGMEWVRFRLDWGVLEPEQGVFDWSLADGVVNAVVAAGLEPVVVLDGSPTWARGPLDVGDADNPFAPPADYDDFATFATAFAQRHGDRVRYYQIWDEPNIAPHWGNHRIDPVGYAQLLKVAAEAIREVDADAFILNGAVAPTADRGHTAIDEVYFLQRMIASGAAPYFDAIAIEPFGFGSAPTNPRQAIGVLSFQRAAVVRRALVATELGDASIWAVRHGWNTRHDSPWGTVSAEDQLLYAQDVRAVAQSWRWLDALGWAIDQPAAPQSDPVWGFALTDELLATYEQSPRSLRPADARLPALWFAGSVVLVALLVADGWRDARKLRWKEWRIAASPRPLWLVAAWALLALVYHLATAPWLIGLCWLVAALLAMIQPRYALYGALALLPFYFQHKEIAFPNRVLTVPPTHALVLALTPALIIELRSLRRRKWRTGKAVAWYDALAFAWLGIGLLSAFGVWNWPEFGRGMLDLVVVPLLLYVGVRLWVQDGASTRGALMALFAGGLLVAMLGLRRWLGGSGVEVDGVLRLVGTHFSPNHTALYLVRSLFVGMGIALAAAGWRRGVWLASVGVVGVALLLTASRGALLLGVPVGMIVCVWLWLGSDASAAMQRVQSLLRRPLVGGLLVALSVLLILALIVGESRLLNAASVDSRFLLWHVAVDLWRAHPVVGVGANGFFWNYPAFLPIGAPLEHDLLHPHNIWIELLTGWGVLGLVWLLVLLGVWFAHAARYVRGLERSLRWCAIGLTAALSAGVAHGQVDAFLALPDLAGWLFAVMGVWVALLASESSKLQKE